MPKLKKSLTPAHARRPAGSRPSSNDVAFGTARYSKRWLAEYGQRLRLEEIRLVQGFRGLSRDNQGCLLALLSDLLIPTSVHHALVVQHELRATARHLRESDDSRTLHDVERTRVEDGVVFRLPKNDAEIRTVYNWHAGKRGARPRKAGAR